MKHIKILLLTLLFYGCSQGYKVDNDIVYYIEWNEARGKVERNISADASTFKILDYENYATDKNNVYYKGNLIESADPISFQPLSEFIGKDKFQGYHNTTAIPHSDGRTFEVIEGNFSRDKNDVYYMYEPLKSTSPKTFEILKIGHGNWAKDGVNYYYDGKKLPNVDYKTFQILDEDCFFAKDKFNVYNRDKILEGVDPTTFKYLEICVGQDKYGCHNGSERCECPITNK